MITRNSKCLHIVINDYVLVYVYDYTFKIFQLILSLNFCKTALLDVKQIFSDKITKHLVGLNIINKKFYI